MNVEDQIQGIGRTLLDFATSFMNLSGHGAMAFAVVLVVALSVAVLAYLLVSRIRASVQARSRRDGMAEERFRKGAIADAPTSNPAFESETSPDQAQSEELRMLAASFEGAINRLAAGGRERHARVLRSHDEIRATLSRMDAAIEDMSARIDGDGARYANIDERFESLAASISDIGDRLTNHGDEPRARSPLGRPLAKLSAEIAEIVRELQDS